MTRTITLIGEPMSTNNIYRSHCRFGRPAVYMTAAGKALKESYQWQAKSQWGRAPSDGKIAISVKLFFKTRRRHDIDNYSKILLDSLTGIVWVDDSQIGFASYLMAAEPDRANPRVEIGITALDDLSTGRPLQSDTI